MTGSCTYLAHHELESIIIVDVSIVVIYFIIVISIINIIVIIVWLQVKVVGAKYGMWGLRKYGTTLTNVDALLFWPDRLACLADQIKTEQRRALKLAVPSAFVTFKSAAVPSLCLSLLARKEKFARFSNHNRSLLRWQPRAVSPSYDVPCPHLKWACLCYALWSACPCPDSAVCCRATTCHALI